MSEQTIHTQYRRHGPAPFHRVLIALGALLLASLPVVWSAPAEAAAPANDAWNTATLVNALPFATTLDTREATTDAVKPPGTRGYVGHSVWYHLRLGSDGPLLLSSKDSTYSPMMRLYHATSASQPPGQWTLVSTVGSGKVVEGLRAGQHYYLMVATHTYTQSDGSTHTAPGGTLTLHVQRPARVSATLAPYGVLDRVAGAAILRGAIQSNHPVQIQMYVKLRQIVNGQAVVGWKSKQFDAIAGRTPWTMAIFTDRSFKLGRARVVANRITAYEWEVAARTVHFPTNLVTLR